MDGGGTRNEGQEEDNQGENGDQDKAANVGCLTEAVQEVRNKVEKCRRRSEGLDQNRCDFVIKMAREGAKKDLERAREGSPTEMVRE